MIRGRKDSGIRFSAVSIAYYALIILYYILAHYMDHVGYTSWGITGYNSLALILAFEAVSALLLIGLFLYTGSFIVYFSTLIALTYVALISWKSIPYYFIFALYAPLILVSIPLIVFVTRGSPVKEPLAEKTGICVRLRVRKRVLLGYFGGLLLGFSLQGLTGVQDLLYPNIAVWILGVITTVPLLYCGINVSPVGSGILSSLSITALPLSSLFTMMAPLTLGGQGCEVVGGLHYWSILDSIPLPGYKYPRRISWHWARYVESCIDVAPRLAEEGLDNRNVVIVGKSGSGKSSLAKRIVGSLLGDMDVLILDYHGEYGNAFTGATIVDPIGSGYYIDFNLMDGKPEYKASIIADVFKEVFKLGERQHALLYESLLDYFASYTDKPLAEALPRLIMEEASLLSFEDKSRIAGLLRYIRQFEPLFKGSEPLNIVLEKGRGAVVIDLSSLPSRYLRQGYGEFILRLVYNSMNKRRKGLVLLVEEAHAFGENSILEDIYSEGRKFGIVSISVTQNPSDLSRSVILNSSFRFVLKLDEPTARDYMANLLAVSDPNLEDLVRATLQYIPKGYAVLYHEPEREVYIVKLF